MSISLIGRSEGGATKNTMTNTMAEMRVISLGWGVQSWGLAAMSALGKLPPVDYAIHADTGWERLETYAFAEKWTPWLEGRGVPVVTVQGPYCHKALELNGSVTPPMFTVGPEGRGMLYRTCTDRWKIRPMQRWLRSKGVSKLEQWIGITLDESHRAKQGNVQYIVNRHPFLEMLDRPWTRGMVVHWLQEQGLEVPVSSNCVICPYQTDLEWRRLKMAGNGDWERAVEVDRAIRDKRPSYKCYLHSSRQPLEGVRLGIEQLEMW